MASRLPSGENANVGRESSREPAELTLKAKNHSTPANSAQERLSPTTPRRPTSLGSKHELSGLARGLAAYFLAPGELASPERGFGNQKAAPKNRRYRRACPAGAIFGL